MGTAFTVLSRAVRVYHFLVTELLRMICSITEAFLNPEQNSNLHFGVFGCTRSGQASLALVSENDILWHSIMAYASQQRVKPGANNARGLYDVDVFTLDARRRCPCEAMEEIRKHELVNWKSKVDSRASSSTRGEGQEMEILAIEIHLGVYEPARHKLVGILPRFWIPVDCVDIDVCNGVGGDTVATDSAFLAAEVGDGQGSGWVEPKRLFHDAVEEWQVCEVGFFHQSVSSHYRVQFCLSCSQVVRVSQKLRDAPLHGCGDAVTAAHNQVLGRHNPEQLEGATVQRSVRSVAFLRRQEKWRGVRESEDDNWTHNSNSHYVLIRQVSFFISNQRGDEVDPTIFLLLHASLRAVAHPAVLLNDGPQKTLLVWLQSPESALHSYNPNNSQPQLSEINSMQFI